MIGYHRQPSSRFEQFGGRQQHFFECRHFVVHFYAQGLKQLGHVFLLPFAAEERFHGLHKVLGRLYAPLCSGFDKCCGYAA